MSFYFFIYIFFLFLSFISLIGAHKTFSKKIELLIFILPISILIFFSSVRDMIAGYDIYVYKAYFEAVQAYSENIFNYELGFFYINKIAAYFFEDFIGLLFLTSIGTWFFIGLGCLKYGRLKYLFLFLILCKLYLMGFVYIRQMLAVSIVFYSYSFLIERRHVLFVTLILLASTFHLSALICLCFLLNLKGEHKGRMLFIIYSFSLLIMFTPLKVVSSYIGYYLVGGDVFNFAVNYLYLLESICLFVFFMIFRKSFRTRTEQVFFFSCCIYIALLVVASKNGTMIRLTWYFFLPVLVSISIVAEKYHRLLYLIFIVVFSLIYFRTLMVWDGGDFVPYQTIFNDSIRPSRWNYLR